MTKKFSYNTAAGRNAALILTNGTVLEVRRDGKSFSNRGAALLDPGRYLPKSEQRMWASEAEWRSSLPVGLLVVDEQNPFPQHAIQLAKAVETIKATGEYTPPAAAPPPAPPTLEQRLKKLTLPKLKIQVTQREKAFAALVAAIQKSDQSAIATARAAYDAAPVSEPVMFELVEGNEPVVWVAVAGKMLPAFLEGDRILIRNGNNYYDLDAARQFGVRNSSLIWKTTVGGTLVMVV